jgi:hypothetical protein
MTSRRPVDAALVYARRGWPVIPLHQPYTRRGEIRCTCGHLDCSSIGKHPHTRDGVHAASVDSDEIQQWWTRWRHAGVGIATGGQAGIVVLDIDPDKGGNDSLRTLLDEHGPLPAGRVVRTGSGGAHHYFHHPERLPNTAGRLGSGIDTRGDGGYVVAPPSRHRSGNQYTLASGGADLPALPDWMLRLIEPPPRPAVQHQPATIGDATRWAQAAIDGEVGRLRTAVEGTRNDTLNRVAFRLGQLIGSGALHENDVEPLLIEQGIAIGLREREVVKTVHSGLRAGEGSPRGPTRAQHADVDLPDIG